MDIRGLALGPMLAMMAACTTPDRCVDGTCRPVSGDYTFVFDPPLMCSTWESSMVSPAPLRIESKADVLAIVLWPFGPNPHTFDGTLYDNGSMNAHEVTNNVLIGLPFADLTGSFAGTDDAYPFTLRASLTLLGAQGADASAGAPADCNTIYSLVAVQRSAPPIDAGSPAVDP